MNNFKPLWSILPNPYFICQMHTLKVWKKKWWMINITAFDEKSAKRRSSIKYPRTASHYDPSYHPNGPASDQCSTSLSKNLELSDKLKDTYPNKRAFLLTTNPDDRCPCWEAAAATVTGAGKPDRVEPFKRRDVVSRGRSGVREGKRRSRRRRASAIKRKKNPHGLEKEIINASSTSASSQRCTCLK